MSRGTRFLTWSIPLAIIYLFMLAGILPVPLISQESADEILPVVSLFVIIYVGADADDLRQIPFWLLVSFGSYSLTSLGLGLLRFNDCPDAYQSLLSEINQAKNELRDQGVNVD